MTTNEIYQYLASNKIYPEHIRKEHDDLCDRNDIAITIKGDWKHDHLRCKYFMEKIGYERVGVIETESDGSDFYTGIHYYEEVK